MNKTGVILGISLANALANTVSSMKSIQARSKALTKEIDALNKKKLNLIADDTSVKKFTEKVERLDHRINLLKNKKINLQTRLITARSQKKIDQLKKKIDNTTLSIKVMNHNKLKLKNELIF